jgi:hypothetical protein
VTLAFAADAGTTKSVKLHGYVAEIRSQNSFDIDDYRVSRESTLSLDFEKDEDIKSDVAVPEDIRVGTELEIKGEYNAETHQLTAKSIKVFPSETRRLKRTAIIESLPNLQKRGTVWEGKCTPTLMTMEGLKSSTSARFWRAKPWTARDRMVASIREYGFKIPVLARSNGEVVDGHRIQGSGDVGLCRGTSLAPRPTPRLWAYAPDCSGYG